MNNMAELTSKEMALFKRGKKEGREEIRAELLKALGIEDIIEDALRKMEDQYAS
jgi:hypothetical protein